MLAPRTPQSAASRHAASTLDLRPTNLAEIGIAVASARECPLGGRPAIQRPAELLSFGAAEAETIELRSTRPAERKMAGSMPAEQTSARERDTETFEKSRSWGGILDFNEADLRLIHRQKEGQ